MQIFKLKNSPSQNLSSSDAGRLGDQHINLTTHILWHLARTLVQLSKHGLTLVNKRAELSTSGLVWISKHKLLASGNVGAATSKADGREGLNVEVRAGRAG